MYSVVSSQWEIKAKDTILIQMGKGIYIPQCQATIKSRRNSWSSSLPYFRHLGIIEVLQITENISPLVTDHILLKYTFHLPVLIFLSLLPHIVRQDIKIGSSYFFDRVQQHFPGKMCHHFLYSVLLLLQSHKNWHTTNVKGA